MAALCRLCHLLDTLRTPVRFSLRRKIKPFPDGWETRKRHFCGLARLARGFVNVVRCSAKPQTHCWVTSLSKFPAFSEPTV
jgi:hypothetical protein